MNIDFANLKLAYLAHKKEFEKEKQRKRQEFFANRNKKRKKSR